MRLLARLPARVAIAFIRGYQRSLGRLMPPRCRFHPSCSEYAAQAIEVNGLARGGAAALWRLLRCAPWSRGGIDPVKPRTARVEAARG